MNTLEALTTIREQSNLSDDEWSELCEVVANRLDPSTTRTVSGAQNEAQSDHQAITGLSAWMTRGDLARALGVPLDHVKKWHARGKLPKPDEMVGNRAVWSRRTVKLWAQELTRLANGGT